MKVEWVDRGIEPQSAPDPNFPKGVDLDVSNGASKCCLVTLPYPAPRCGYYVITCERCKQVSVVTTAGRPDDPRSFKTACRLDA